MTIASKLLPIAALSFFTSAALATTTPFVGGTLGQTSANFNESSRASVQMPGVNFDSIIDDSGSWGLRAGRDLGQTRYYVSYDYVSDSYRSAARIRHQMLSAAYDLMLPLDGGSTRLFAGANAGLTRLDQKTGGYRHDDDWGIHAGIQAGLLRILADNVELEAGYRYAKHEDAAVDFKPRGASTRSGSARLSSTEQLYMGVNWRF